MRHLDDRIVACHSLVLVVAATFAAVVVDGNCSYYSVSSHTAEPVVVLDCCFRSPRDVVVAAAADMGYVAAVVALDR